MDVAGTLNDADSNDKNLGRGDKSDWYLILRLVIGVMGGEENGQLVYDPFQVLRFWSVKSVMTAEGEGVVGIDVGLDRRSDENDLDARAS